MKAVVCGAGIAGLSVSWWLEHHGWEILVVERAPALRDAGYMMDFFASGYDAAELMGILPQLEAVAYDVAELAYVDAEGRATSRLRYDTFRALQGGRLLALMRGDLEHVPQDRCGQPIGRPVRTTAILFKHCSWPVRDISNTGPGSYPNSVTVTSVLLSCSEVRATTCGTSRGTSGGMPMAAGSSASPFSSANFETNSIRSIGTIAR